MKTLIKLVIVGLLLVGCARAGWASFNNFQFEDAVQQRLLFETRASEDEIVNIVMKIASEYAVPLKEADIVVSQVGQDRIVEMNYTMVLDLVPGVFKYPWQFTPRATTRLLSGISR
jgi:hypothetical protein